jgi:hypothetical protein
LDHKDALTLNSDNARLIRLFSTRTDHINAVQQVRIKPGEIVKQTTNMDDAQLIKQPSLFPLYLLLV